VFSTLLLDFFRIRPVSHGNLPIFEWRKEPKSWLGITRPPFGSFLKRCRARPLL
jgi:hypothetical protein